MQTKKYDAKTVVYRLITGLALVRVLFGVIWMCLNLGDLTVYREGKHLLLAAEKLTGDEYTGVIYPLFIRLLQLIFGEGYSFRVFLSLITITICGLSVYFLVSMSTDNRLIRMMSVAFTVTNPTFLSASLTISRGPLIAAVFLFCYAAVSKGIKHFKKKEKFPFGRNMVFVGLIIIIMICNYSFAVPGSLGYGKRTVSLMKVERFAWPYMTEMSGAVDYRFREDYTDAVINSLCHDSELIYSDFGPKAEAFLGDEAARKVFDEVAHKGVVNRPGTVIKDIVVDFVAYFFAPFTTFVVRDGMTGMQTGAYKDMLMGNTPMFSMIYYRFDAGVTFFALGMAIAVLIKNIADRERVASRVGVIAGYVSLIVASLYATFLATRGFSPTKIIWNTTFVPTGLLVYDYLAVTKGNRSE